MPVYLTRWPRRDLRRRFPSPWRFRPPSSCWGSFRVYWGRRCSREMLRHTTAIRKVCQSLFGEPFKRKSKLSVKSTLEILEVGMFFKTLTGSQLLVVGDQPNRVKHIIDAHLVLQSFWWIPACWERPFQRKICKKNKLVTDAEKY